MPVTSEPLQHFHASELFPRNVLTPNATQRTTLIVAGCYILIIAILWYFPVLPS